MLSLISRIGSEIHGAYTTATGLTGAAYSALRQKVSSVATPLPNWMKTHEAFFAYGVSAFWAVRAAKHENTAKGHIAAAAKILTESGQLGKATELRSFGKEL